MHSQDAGSQLRRIPSLGVLSLRIRPKRWVRRHRAHRNVARPLAGSMTF